MNILAKKVTTVGVYLTHNHTDRNRLNDQCIPSKVTLSLGLSTEQLSGFPRENQDTQVTGGKRQEKSHLSQALWALSCHLVWAASLSRGWIWDIIFPAPVNDHSKGCLVEMGTLRTLQHRPLNLFKGLETLSMLSPLLPSKSWWHYWVFFF